VPDVDVEDVDIGTVIRENEVVLPAISTEGARSVMKRLCDEADLDVDGEYLKPHGARRGLGDELYRTIVGRYHEEAFNEERIDLLDELIAEDVVNHNPLSDETLTPEEVRGFEGFRRHFQVAHEAFPDASVTIEDMVAEGDTVSVRFIFEGTHEGRFGGIAPTGNRVFVSNMGLFRIEDGKIVERWL
jgi:steroid delta-isomerase-like uncharacterized protein